VPRIKGVNLAHTRDFVEAEYGLEGWAAVGAELSTPTRHAIESALAVGWYPAELHVELLHAIVRALGPREEAILRHVSAHDAEYDVTRIHRLLFRFATPPFLLEKVGEIWLRYYDAGRWTVERPTPTSTRATLHAFDVADPLYCAYLGGFFVRLWELVGATDVRLRHPVCRAKGDTVCRWDGQWR